MKIVTTLFNVLEWLEDQVLRLLPGSKDNAGSFEARVRASKSFAMDTLARATHRHQKVIDDVQARAAARVAAIEEAMRLNAEELEALTLAPDEVMNEATTLQASEMHERLSGE